MHLCMYVCMQNIHVIYIYIIYMFVYIYTYIWKFTYFISSNISTFTFIIYTHLSLHFWNTNIYFNTCLYSNTYICICIFATIRIYINRDYMFAYLLFKCTVLKWYTYVLVYKSSRRHFGMYTFFVMCTCVRIFRFSIYNIVFLGNSFSHSCTYLHIIKSTHTHLFRHWHFRYLRLNSRSKDFLFVDILTSCFGL